MAQRKSPTPLKVSEAMAFSGTIRSETDRGAALVGAALLDDLLGGLLAAAFVDDAKASDKMLQYPGACSTFAARADLAYCLGLIGPDVLRDLSTIRKLRNQFAHSPWQVSFAKKEVAAICNQLEVIAWMRERGTEVGMSARGKFEFTVTVLASNIARATEKRKHAKVAPRLRPDRLLDTRGSNPLGY